MLRCVVVGDEADSAAKSLAGRLGLAVVSREEAARFGGLYLAYEQGCLSLGRLNSRDKPVAVDFTALARRGMELLVKAVGGGDRRPSVVDATAGLGRDGIVLASHGYPVTLVERDAVLSALLQDGLQRAAGDPRARDIVARMRLVHADAGAWLEALPDENRPDAIYLDPMFPERDKSALVKKELRLLQDLLGEQPDAESLLEVALHRARHRVVVKRPRKARPLGGKSPGFTVEGKAVRFDVYPLRRYD